MARNTRDYVLPEYLMDEDNLLAVNGDLKLFDKKDEGKTHINVAQSENSEASKYLYIESDKVNVKTPFGEVKSIKNLLTYMKFEMTDPIYSKPEVYYNRNHKNVVRKTPLNRKAIILYTVLSWAYQDPKLREILSSDEIKDLPFTYIREGKFRDNILGKNYIRRTLIKSSTCYYVKALEVARILARRNWLTPSRIKELVDINTPAGSDLFVGFCNEEII